MGKLYMTFPFLISFALLDVVIYKVVTWAHTRTRGLKTFGYVLGGFLGLVLVALAVGPLGISAVENWIVGVVIGAVQLAAVIGIFCAVRRQPDRTTRQTYTADYAEDEDTQIDVDSMEGTDFERFCADLLRAHGYTDIYITPGSGDQGIDITAEKDGLKWGFQCKRWGVETNVGNNEVMQTYAGKAFYHCDIAAVITTSHFTRKAEEYAQQTGVLLWGRDKLFQMMEKMNEAPEPEAPPMGGTVREVEFVCQRCGNTWYMTKGEIRSAKAARRQARSMKISRMGTLNLRKARNLTTQLSIVERAGDYGRCPACGSHNVTQRKQ